MRWRPEIRFTLNAYFKKGRVNVTAPALNSDFAIVPSQTLETQPPDPSWPFCSSPPELMKKHPVLQCPPCLPFLLLCFIPKLWKSLWAAGDWDLNWPNRERAKQGSELELLAPYKVIIAKKQPPPLSILGLSRIWRKLGFVKQGKFEKLLHGGSSFLAP